MAAAFFQVLRPVHNFFKDSNEGLGIKRFMAAALFLGVTWLQLSAFGSALRVLGRRGAGLVVYRLPP